MSFILNALRKSELERHANQPESLESRILETPLAEQKKTSVWLVLLVLVNVFFLLFFIWSFTKEDNKDAIENITQASEESAAKQDSKVKDLEKTIQLPIVKVESNIQVSESTKTKKQPVQNSQNGLKPLVQPVIIPSKRIDEPKLEIAITNQNKTDLKQNLILETEKKTGQLSIAEKIVKQKTKPVITQLNEQKPALKAKAKQNIELEQKKTKPQLAVSLPSAPKLPKKMAPEPEDYPFLDELPQAFKRSVPKFDINVFVYSENKQDRFIMIKMEKYVPGQQMSQGMKLKAIRMNSVVVEYQNKTFQIKRR